MDDKTEELRDIFVSVSGEEEVTERQAEQRGSLADDGRTDVREVIERLREREGFDTDLSTEDYRRVAAAFFAGADDAAVAEELEVEEPTARRARLDLHLYEEADLDPPFDADAARERLLDGEDPAAVADALDADGDAVRRYAVALRARNRSLRANHRFRTGFEEALADGDLTGRLVEDVRDDGLEEATEDMEVDVSF